MKDAKSDKGSIADNVAAFIARGRRAQEAVDRIIGSEPPPPSSARQVKR